MNNEQTIYLLSKRIVQLQEELAEADRLREYWEGRCAELRKLRNLDKCEVSVDEITGLYTVQFRVTP